MSVISWILNQILLFKAKRSETLALCPKLTGKRKLTTMES